MSFLSVLLLLPGVALAQFQNTTLTPSLTLPSPTVFLPQVDPPYYPYSTCYETAFPAICGTAGYGDPYVCEQTYAITEYCTHACTTPEPTHIPYGFKPAVTVCAGEVVTIVTPAPGYTPGAKPPLPPSAEETGQSFTESAPVLVPASLVSASPLPAPGTNGSVVAPVPTQGGVLTGGAAAARAQAGAAALAIVVAVAVGVFV